MPRAQHLAIRVSDIKRSTEFYVTGLGGSLISAPRIVEGPISIFPGATYYATFVELSDGFGIELIQFLSPAHETVSRPQTERGFMHFAIDVDDVEAVLRRIEELGIGSHEGLGAFGDSPTKYVYVRDPDGNTIEVNNTTWDDVMATAKDLLPEVSL
ncbi:VOC family protein [Streptomyces sp. NPDC005799]|uniref:VOC family protein n=1 Tax=Streptomyces sp. NPDC005799 TaxID=3154678 RepID=UPI0033CD6E60